MDAMPLDIARDAFSMLVTGPAPLSVDGRWFRGLPDRLVPLDELRDRLLSARCARRTRDAVWADLVRRSRTGGPEWTVGAVGVALPALTSVAATLSARFAGDPADVHAEILSGFVAELARVDVGRPRIVLRLRWAAYRAGHRAVRDALDAPTPVDLGFRSHSPSRPWGHPDLVLARAVADRVLTRTEADLIGATRLDHVPVAVWADAQNVTEWAAYKARRRAEQRLVAHLHDTHLDPAADPVAYQASTSPAVPWSPVVTTGPGVSPGVRRRVRRRRVSKTGAQTGVQGCGSTPLSSGTQEGSRCA